MFLVQFECSFRGGTRVVNFWEIRRFFQGFFGARFWRRCFRISFFVRGEGCLLLVVVGREGRLWFGWIWGCFWGFEIFFWIWRRIGDWWWRSCNHGRFEIFWRFLGLIRFLFFFLVVCSLSLGIFRVLLFCFRVVPLF